MLSSDAGSALNALPDGVLIADAERNVSVINTVAERMLGISSAEAIGQPLSQVLRVQETGGRSWAEVNPAYDSLGTVTGIPEQAWLLPDGTEVLVVARIHRPRPTDPVEQVALVLRSGRGRARLDRERSDLVATVAHELRSPLTGVKGFVQALLNRWDKLNDEQKKLMLTTVAADADRLSRLIAELLDVARIDTGRLQLYPRPSDARVLVARIVDSVSAGTARDIELVADVELPDVLVDPDKFTQVVTNLVENAVRHGEGDVRVRVVRMTQESDFDDGVRITVTDQGEGIPPEMRRRVFTKFWTGGVRGGSGLGLYIVNGLVRAHGGTVDISDAEGGGAQIDVRWPAGDPADL